MPRITNSAKHGGDVHCDVIGGVRNSADEPIDLDLNLNLDRDRDLNLNLDRRCHHQQRDAFTIIA